MNFVSVFMAVFSVIAAVDLIFGNRFGLGKEFERGFMLLGTMMLSMTGMIIIAPLIGEILMPFFDIAYKYLHIDPSLFPAMIFANDMGGAPLSVEVAKDPALGLYNGLIVSSMMGVTISFTIPVVLNMAKPEIHKEVLLGVLCGIVTVPIGCFASGLFLKLKITTLLFNLIPLIIFSALITCGLVFIPNVCVKIFGVLGKIIKILIIIGLTLGLIKALTGFEPIKGLDTYEEGGRVCLNASAVMSGAFPFMYIVSKLIKKPLNRFGKKIGINETSALGLVSSLATSMTTFGIINDMDKKGVVLNSAFAVSAAFTFAGHLAFTLAFDDKYIFPMIIGKIIAGVTAFLMALLIYKRTEQAEIKEI